MRDLMSTVWVILILIGVVSSIINAVRKMVKNAEMSAVPVAQQQQQTVHEQAFGTTPASQPMPAPEMPQPGIVLPAAEFPAVVSAPIVITKRKAKAAVAGAAAPDPPSDIRAKQDGTEAWRGMFERENLARAFVAAQVFGPPKALQEQSLWSPRSSEPSI